VTLTFGTEPLSVVTRLIRAVAEMLGRAARDRRQRLALADLLTMSPARLDDLGITHQDVLEAVRARRSAGQHLARRQAERADAALARCVACAS
jgi:uncharacterized protein YjiS (DUF1127 family)